MHATSSVKYSTSNIKSSKSRVTYKKSCQKTTRAGEFIPNRFLTDCAFKTSKDVILPNCSTLVVLRYTYEENDRTTKRNNHNS